MKRKLNKFLEVIIEKICNPCYSFAACKGCPQNKKANILWWIWRKTK
jgi:hypothetical protein